MNTIGFVTARFQSSSFQSSRWMVMEINWQCSGWTAESLPLQNWMDLDPNCTNLPVRRTDWPLAFKQGAVTWDVGSLVSHGRWPRMKAQARLNWFYCCLSTNQRPSEDPKYRPHKPVHEVVAAEQQVYHLHVGRNQEWWWNQRHELVLVLSCSSSCSMVHLRSLSAKWASQCLAASNLLQHTIYEELATVRYLASCLPHSANEGYQPCWLEFQLQPKPIGCHNPVQGKHQRWNCEGGYEFGSLMVPLQKVHERSEALSGPL